MEIKEIQEKNIWENFLLGCSDKTFLNSWNWGEFQQKIGGKIWRLGFFEDDLLVAVALVEKIKARRGTFLFVPHGPNIQTQNSKPKSQNHNSKTKTDIIKTLLGRLGQAAKGEKANFIRIAPIFENTEENKKIFGELGFRNAPAHMHPELTWELDITPPEEELLGRMRKTTRYLIRQAQKNKDIEIVKSLDEESLEQFHRLYGETVDRHHFVPFSSSYLKNELSSFNSDRQILIFLGKYRGEVVSTAVIVFWQNAGFYHHGASSQRFARIPVSYLLQWEAIKEAKIRGCDVYNFWGIAPESDKKPRINPFGIIRGRHPWTGLSLFKMGFGGYKKEYVKTQDLPLSWRYWPIAVFEALRKKKRGL